MTDGSQRHNDTDRPIRKNGTDDIDFHLPFVDFTRVVVVVGETQSTMPPKPDIVLVDRFSTDKDFFHQSRSLAQPIIFPPPPLPPTSVSANSEGLIKVTKTSGSNSGQLGCVRTVR